MTLPAPSRPFNLREPLSPVERYVPLLFRTGVYAFLTLFFFQAMDAFIAYRPGVPWGRLLWIFRTFTFLPLHEGGHFLFRFFGRTLYVIGGSFWQIMFPMLWFIIAFRQRSQVFPFALFWVGENMMDVSLYIRDAPLRALPLLGGDKSGHDWHYLLGQWDMMDSADTLADIGYYAGAAICICAIATGVIWAGILFVRSGHPVPLAPPESKNPARAVEDTLDDEIRNEEHEPRP